MIIADVVEAIVEQLVADLPDDYQVYNHNPYAITTPAVLVAPNPSSFDEDFDGGWTLNLAVIVLLSHTGNAADVQRRLWEHAQPSGDLSLRAILDDIDLDALTDVDELVVTGFEAPGRFELGGTEYAGVQVNVEVTS